MTKPRLAKVRALFYVLQQVTKKRLRHFDTASELLASLPLQLFLQSFEICFDSGDILSVIYGK